MSDAHHEEIAKLETLYDEHPEGRIFTHLAEAYRKAGRLERAHEVLQDGIRRHPDYSSAHVVLGRVLLDEGRSADAAGEFRRVLELDPQNLVATRSLGDIAHEDGDHATALEFYERLLAQDPNSEVKEIVEELSGTGAGADEAGAGTGGDQGGEESVAAEADWESDDWGFESLGSADDLGSQPGAGEWGGELTEAERDDEWPTAAWSDDEPDDFADGVEDTDTDVPESEEGGVDLEAAPTGDASYAERRPFEESAESFAESRDPFGGFAGDGSLELTEEGAEESVEEEIEIAEGDPVTDMPDEPVDGGWPIRTDPGGDAESEADAESDEEEDAGAVASDRAGEQASAFPAGEQEVRTETIAWIYARQGLYERAAEVYRDLLQTRPDDADLRARLAEMEEAARAQRSAPAGSGEGEEAERSEDVIGERKAARVVQAEVVDRDPETGLITSVGEAESDLLGDDLETEDMDDAAAADSSPPIREYFGALLAWSPTEGRGGVAGEGETGDGLEEPEAQAGPERPGDDGSDAGPERPRDGSDAEMDPVRDEAIGDPDSGPEPRSRGGGSEDDDLEMFRSWLESLKQ